MPSNVYERDLIGDQVNDDIDDGFIYDERFLDTLNSGVPTSLEFAKAPSPNAAGSRAASTPGKSPLKGGVYWFAGAGEEQGEPVDSNDYRNPDSYWFAQAADGDNLFLNAGNGDCQDQDGPGGMFSQIDREERIRILRERQTEERQKKLDELKLAALHAQKVREQQEEDRRRKIDELRMRDHERRSQVEERKKMIWEAEKGRKEAILRKNLEREARIEAKRNAQRSSIGFAFGSSTPRIFDVDSGYFGSRRAASQSNMSTSMINGGSRHSAEREIEKKKAVSAYSLDNKTGEDLMTRSCTSIGTPLGRGRRKTDLHPTIPVHDSPRNQSPATRTTPSSPSRPNSSLSQQSMSSHASQNSVTMRARTPARRSNRPMSIAGTTPDSPGSGEERQGRSTDRKAATPAPKTPRAKSVGAERIVGDISLSVAKAPLPSARKPPTAARVESTNKKVAANNSPREKPKVAPKPAKLLAKASPKQSPTVEQAPPIPVQAAPDEPAKEIPLETKTESAPLPKEAPIKKPKAVEAETVKTANIENIPSREETPPPVAETVGGISGKPRITTEDEAKAALAERRRQAREQAEREAELERLRQEELQRQEEERIRLEEEERQRWEQEQDELRKIEADRLQKAIEEQSLKEEEEKKKKEEEAKLKIEREEQERKAREEQEKIRKETEERLRKEEEERAERRKRVEAIMSRTRGKGGSGTTGNTPVTTPTKPNAELPGNEQTPMQSSLIVESKPNKVDDLMSTSMPSVVTSDSNSPQDWNDEVDEGASDPVYVTSDKHNGDVNARANGVSTNPFAQEMDHGLDEQVAEMKVADDFASRDIINQKPQLTNADFEQLIDLSVCPPTTTFSKNEDFINNADSLNSNVPSNGTTAPFIAFEDNFAKKQETNVTDLLS